RNDPIIKKWLIPTENAINFEQVLKFLKTHNTIVLKPIRSTQGRNVYLIRKYKRKFIIGFEKSEITLSKRMFKKFYEKKVGTVEFIVQKYIDSRDPQGNPIDCRIHVEKNEHGKWKTARNFVRIGV